MQYINEAAMNISRKDPCGEKEKLSDSEKERKKGLQDQVEKTSPKKKNKDNQKTNLENFQEAEQRKGRNKPKKQYKHASKAERQALSDGKGL